MRNIFFPEDEISINDHYFVCYKSERIVYANYNIVIPNKLNWIDRAKSLAIAFVVFGHILEERSRFYISYIVESRMLMLIFISGYMTKKEFPNKVTFTKCWHTLIISYLCYIIIFYLFWGIAILLTEMKESIIR